MYRTNINGHDYVIHAYDTDSTLEYDDAKDLVTVVTIDLADGTTILYYHPGTVPVNWKSKARVAYRGLKLLTSRTLPGAVLNALGLILKIDVIEKLIFGQDHPKEGYYLLFSDAKRCIFPGKLHSRFIS